MKKEIIFLFLFLFCLPVLYGQSKRELRFLENWSFKAFDGPVNAYDPDFLVDKWEKVALPHSWVTETKHRKLVHKNAWYRNTFNLRGDLGARRVYIFFERVSINATVYVNGQFAGKHKGPVTSFIFDITGLTKPSNENLISVKVDNSQDLQSMPANFFGGMLGRVKLITAGEIHIDPLFYASSGCFIEPIEVDEKTAKFRVITRIRNTSEEEHPIIIKNTLFKDKRIICQNDKNIILKPNYTEVGEMRMQFEDPVLWSPEEPSLYEMKTQIYRGKELLDEIIQVTGFRNFRITSDNFWLNGKPLKLYGVNYTHPSNEKEGAAITDSSIRADLDDMKYELGINAVRFAHWPFPKAAYEHADSIGLVVMTENGYAWHEEIEIGTEGERLTKEMIYQNFNHPSILFWSSGNENPHKGYEYYAKAIREADSSRIIVCVDDKNDFILRGKLNIPFKNHDAVFQNKYTGWYDGPPWNFDIFTRIIHLIGETGAGSLRTNHQPYDAISFERSGFEPEEWAQIVCEAIFQTSFVNHPEQIDALFIWHYRDVFSGKYKGYNTKGLIAAGGFKKDLYYLYQSFLKPEKDILQIVGKHWYVRENENDLKVYSNAVEIKLTVNGKAAGSRINGLYKHGMYNDQVVNNVFYWNDILVPGINDIKVSDNKGNIRECRIFLIDGENNILVSNPAIRDLRTTNTLNESYLLDMPPTEQYPVYLNEGDIRTTGFDADNTFMNLPSILDNSQMIITRRQSHPDLNSDISFKAKKNIRVYVLLTGVIIPDAFQEAGFEETGISGKWRDNDSNPVEWSLYRKNVLKGSEIVISPGLVDYVTFITNN